MNGNVSCKAAFGVLMVATTAFSDFKPCGFNVGVDLKQASTKKCSYMGCTTNANDLDIPKEMDFVAMFVGYAYEGGKVAPKPLETPEGTFLSMAKSLNATPVWYTYIIAEGAKLAGGLSDCNMGSSKTLCTDGTKYIRENKAKILDQYKAYAQFANSKYGSKPMIWALEPDFYQYASNQNGNSSPLSYADAASFIGEIANTITSAMPSAQISMDISPWAPDAWFKALPLNKFKYMNTSGGISQPGTTVANGNPMTWAKIHDLTKLPIIADDGYGTGGTLTSPNSNWGNVNTIKSRMADGVIALMEAAPGSSWTSTISTIHAQATSTTCPSNAISGRTVHGSKVELRGEKLSVMLEHQGKVEFSLVSLDGKEVRNLGTVEMHGQSQVFGLGGTVSGLKILRMRGEGWESTVPMATLSR